MKDSYNPSCPTARPADVNQPTYWAAGKADVTIYTSTKGAGKFPAEFGGQRRRFWRLSSLDAKIAPLVSSYVRPHPPRSTFPRSSIKVPFSCTTQPSLGTRNSPLSETERDPSNSSKMTGIFDYSALAMAPLEPGGTVPVVFLTLPQRERALSDLRKLDSNCVPSPISSCIPAALPNFDVPTGSRDSYYSAFHEEFLSRPSCPTCQWLLRIIHHYW